MKKILSLLTVTAVLVACNSNGDSASNKDSTTTTTTTTTSTTKYAARADSFRVNSQAGNYLDPRTGKALRIKYDTVTHLALNEETGTPVIRYVDRRNWDVYGYNNDDWNSVGTARVQGDRIEYKGDNDKWMTYEERWKAEDARMNNNGTMSSDSSTSSQSTTTTTVDNSNAATEGTETNSKSKSKTKTKAGVTKTKTTEKSGN